MSCWWALLLGEVNPCWRSRSRPEWRLGGSPGWSLAPGDARVRTGGGLWRRATVWGWPGELRPTCTVIPKLWALAWAQGSVQRKQYFFLALVLTLWSFGLPKYSRWEKMGVGGGAESRVPVRMSLPLGSRPGPPCAAVTLCPALARVLWPVLPHSP